MDKISSTDLQFLAQIKKIIGEHLDKEHFSVEDLARESGMSRSKLHRRLTNLTGKSASEIITTIRLEEAWDMLEKNTETVSEISYRVGYQDSSYFGKVFKKHFNISPGEVRKGNIPASYTLKKLTLNPQAGNKPDRKFLKKFAAIILAFILVASSIYLLQGRNNEKERSIAVLPIKNYTGDPENAYFIDGMHDALIGELSRIESLRVISRTSTNRYRDSNELMKNIAKELGVNTLIESSVQLIEDSLRLIIQVIDVFPKETHLMYEEYTDDTRHILNLHRNAAMDIAKNMGIKAPVNVTQQPRLVNPETYKLYLKGMFYLNMGSHETFREGISFMLKAIESDPGDPLPYAGLALGYAMQGHGLVLPEGTFAKAAEAAEKALRIDPTLDEAYTALALIHSYQVWDWDNVKSDFEKALSNNPNSAVAHLHYSFYHWLFNNPEQALYHLKKSTELEPFSAFNHASLAYNYFMNGYYKEAEKEARISLDLQHDIPYGLLVLGWTYLQKKDYEKALEIHKKLPTYDYYYRMLIGHTYIQTNQREKAEACLDELEALALEGYVNPVFRGILAGMLGYNDRAFELLFKAVGDKTFPITYIKVYPGLNEFKKDPRYAELLKKMNLPAI